MNKQESLAVLQSVVNQMEGMSDSQLFDYMMNNSKTFKDHYENMLNDEIVFVSNNVLRNVQILDSENISSQYIESDCFDCDDSEDDIWLQIA